MNGTPYIIKYLGTFVSILLLIVSLGSLYNSLGNRISMFEGAAIALLSVIVILLMMLYYRIELLTYTKRRR